MTSSGDEWALLRRVLKALAGAHSHITLIGGWAFRAYSLHPDSGPVEGEPIATLDADLVLSPRIDIDVDAALRRDGFRKQRSGTSTRPIERFTMVISGDEMEVEFLAHRAGAEVKQDVPDVLGTLGNVTVQRLPHLDMLVADAIELEVPPSATEPAMKVRVPHPAAFVFHKFMILRQRAKDDRPKDLRYVHDVLVRFADELPQWRREHPLAAAALRRVRSGLAMVTSDLIANAARIGSPTSPARFAATLRAALERVDPGLAAVMKFQPQ